MGQVSKHGRTVLFVSHNLAAVRALCSKAILLSGGRLAGSGSAADVVEMCLNVPTHHSQAHTVAFRRPDYLDVWVESATLLINGEPGTKASTGDRLTVRATFASRREVHTLLFGVLVSTREGERLLCTNNHFLRWSAPPRPPREGSIVCDLGRVPLMEGAYSLSLWFGCHPHYQQHEANVLSFEVHDRDIWGTSRTPPRGLSFLWWDAKFYLS
jgi:lipopolysaccharide transport system ATP-binding protein